MQAPDLLFLLLALLLGALMSRTSLCTVAAIRELVIDRRWSSLRRILAASSAAACVLLGCVVVGGLGAYLPTPLPIVASLLIGGALLGIGALINGACYLGSVLYLGRGNLNFLLTLAGIAIATALWHHVMPTGPATDRAVAMQPVMLAPLLSAPNGLAIFVLLLLLALLASWRATGAAHAGEAAREPQRLPLLVATATGACAGLIGVLHPGWSYGVVIEALVRGRAGMWLGLASAVLLFAGAWAGSLLQHRFQLTAMQPGRALRCLAGGLVMGFGAQQIPGGNDSLLLWAIPGLALYGVVAYAVMASIIAAAFFADSPRRRGARHAGLSRTTTKRRGLDARGL